MKKRLLLVLALSIVLTNYAQNGINYKAIVKDNLGNVVANQTIDVQFIILEDATNVYQETHAPTTDANGLIIVNIGEGTTSDDFSTINWGSDDHFLNVQIDTGSGLTDMGTTQFMAVPYALHAANVTGLEALDEGNGVGWRLKGRDPDNHGDIGQNAVDMTFSLPSFFELGATGSYSIAMGYSTIASGSTSTSMGNQTTASGDSSTAMGRANSASGYASTALGYYTEASGFWSTTMGGNTIASGYSSAAMGEYTKAESHVSTALGRYNTGGGNPTSWVAIDPLFEIGNGTNNSNRSNALTVLKNGTITAPSFDLAEITDDKALITKEYADANIPEAASGLEALDEGNGVGWRIAGRNPARYGNIGLGAVDLSNPILGNSTTRGATGEYSIAMGYNTTASGDNSVSIGNYSTASGESSTAFGSSSASGSFSVAMGFNASAQGERSFAMGLYSYATGTSSLAFGDGANASGNFAIAMGRGTIAEASSSTVIGRFNVGGGNATSWVATDPVFEIGNGTDYDERANALTVLKNGKIGIDKHTGINAKLDIDHASSQTSPQINIKETSGTYARLNISNAASSEYWAIAGSLNGTTSTDRLNFYHSDAGDIMSILGNGNVLVNGSVVHSSDRRLKENIETIPYGLDQVLQLQPKAYNWKAKPDQDNKSLGLIAQEVQTVIQEIVHEAEDEDKTLSVSYTELIPVLIKAIQEQQDIIENQKKEIQVLTAEQKTTNNRLNKIEALINTTQ